MVIIVLCLLKSKIYRDKMKFKRVLLWISGWATAQEELDLFSRMVPLEAWESQDRHLILIFFLKQKFFTMRKDFEGKTRIFQCFQTFSVLKLPTREQAKRLMKLRGSPRMRWLCSQ